MVPLYSRDGLPSLRKPKSLADAVLVVERAYLVAALHNFDVVCVQIWTKLSHRQCSCSAPFPDFGLVISMMKNWFTLEHLALLSLLAIFKSSANTRRSIYARPACKLPGCNMAPSSSPGSSLPGPHGYGWLCKSECGYDPASHFSVEIQWMTRPAAPQPVLDLITCGCTSGYPTQHCTSSFKIFQHTSHNVDIFCKTFRSDIPPASWCAGKF